MEIKPKDWRPWEVPYEYWKNHPELHNTWGEMFPDTNRGPDAKANEGIPDGDITVPDGEGKDGPEVHADDSEPSEPKKSYWTEDEEKMCFTRLDPRKVCQCRARGEMGPNLEPWLAREKLWQNLRTARRTRELHSSIGSK